MSEPVPVVSPSIKPSDQVTNMVGADTLRPV